MFVTMVTLVLPVGTVTPVLKEKPVRGVYLVTLVGTPPAVYSVSMVTRLSQEGMYVNVTMMKKMVTGLVVRVINVLLDSLFHFAQFVHKVLLVITAIYLAHHHKECIHRIQMMVLVDNHPLLHTYSVWFHHKRVPVV